MVFIKKNIEFYKIQLAIIFVVIAILIGITGYMIIEDLSFLDALYFSIITLSTVGFGLLHDLSPAGKIFTIILIIIYISIFTFSITVITSYIIDGEFRKKLNKFRMDKKIESFKDHVIIIGYGRNGSKCVDELLNKKVKMVIIESDLDEIENIKNRGLSFIMGDATIEETLLDANLKNAKSLITTLPLDTANVFVVLTARKICPKISITSRAANESSIDKLKSAGANHVVMPENIGGHYMANLITRPGLIEFYHLLTDDSDVNIRTEGIEYKDLKKEFKDQSISEINFRRKTGVNILAIKYPNGEFTINPSPEIIFKKDTTLIALGSKVQIQMMNKIYTNE
ncbi:MAG: NAD-binding protein [Bacteroidota bacterium]|nr:NAD-binding protein [Bacteroidota bacterium]